MKLLEGKKALITGGSRGIGKAIVEVFVKEGAEVAFTYLSSEESAKKIVDDLQSYGKVVAIKSNAANYQEAEELVKQVIDALGGVDILVNNAGITRDNLIMRMSEEQWDEVIQTNLKSVFNLTKQVMRPMMKARSGSIINISSIVGMRGNAGQSNYAASKGGIIAFTKSIAQEIGSRNIRCNAIAPGFIETDMTDALGEEAKDAFIKNIPLKRLGTPEDIANAAAFLGSDLATYISGQTLSVCGALNC
ncbi:MAG: 3-oxoacyl-[acyl-carrier-protein] reductase [Bacteroidetes bacterium]|nr:3-oxoacyl-[acyl-carrier-protein] reductase [Bacteroidota bacterium]